MAKQVINAFNGGEVSPYLYAREDVPDLYNKSCLKMENFVPLPYGGATKRPATKYLGASHSGQVRLIPFIFSVTENYLLEFGNLYVRVWKNDSPHQSGGSDIVLTTPYLLAELDDIQFTQSADVLFLAHKNHAPREISRSSDTSWAFSEVTWASPPMLAENTDTTIKISTSSASGQTTLTSTHDLFNANMVGGYFSFEQARLNANVSLEKSFTASGVSESINVSNTTWDFETSGTWSGRVIIQRSIDGGDTFSTYITVADTRSITETTHAKNFSISAPSTEGNNTFLRVQYEKGSDADFNSQPMQISLIPTSQTVNSLVRITSHTDAKTVTGTVLSNFQDAIGDYSSQWAADTAFNVGDKIEIAGGIEYSSTTADISAFTGICASIDSSSGNDSDRTVGTYNFIHGTTTGISAQGSGTGARIKVVVASGGVTTVTLEGVSGKDYVVDNTFTILDSALGGGGAANLTFDVASVADSTGLNNTRGGSYGDSKYIAIDKDRKVHLFTRSGDNFMPYDQWTPASVEAQQTRYDIGLDVAYYSNCVYVLSGASEKTVSFFKTGNAGNGNTSVHSVKAYATLKVHKYDLDGTNESEILSDTVANITVGGNLYRASSGNDQVGYQPKAIGFLNGKMYIALVHLGMDYGNPRDAFFKDLIRRYTSTGSLETTFANYEIHGGWSDSPSSTGIPAYIPNATGNALTDQEKPFYTDFSGIATTSVNQLYSLDADGLKLIKYSSDFVNAGSIDLSTQFSDSITYSVSSHQLQYSSPRLTAMFYDDSDSDNRMIWITDTSGVLKKYTFLTQSKYYECIVAVTDSGEGTFETQLADGHWFEVNPKMHRWSQGAFSADRGFPDTVTFFENRLIYAGTSTSPNTLWLSEIDNFTNFKTSTLDTSPMRLTIASGQLDEIQSIIPHKELIILTSGSEWTLGSESDSLPVTPTQFSAKRRTTYGSSSIAGTLVNSALLFIMRQGKKLREWVFENSSQDFVAPDLTLAAEHISGTGFSAIAYQQQPDNIIWTINSDKELVGLTYERDQKVIGWHRQKCTGEFESVAVLPTANGPDAVYVSIKLTINSATVRYICKLDNREWGTNHATEYNGLDYYYTENKAVSSQSVAFSSNELAHFANTAVKVTVNGVLQTGTHTVDADGNLTISSIKDVSNANLANGTYKIVIGIAYTGILAPLYLNETGREGASSGSKLSAPKAFIRFKDTVGKANSVTTSTKAGQLSSGTYGPDSKNVLENIKFTSSGSVTETTEAYLVNAPEYLQTIFIVNDTPTPCTVLSMTPQLYVGDL